MEWVKAALRNLNVHYAAFLAGLLDRPGTSEGLITASCIFLHTPKPVTMRRTWQKVMQDGVVMRRPFSYVKGW